MGHFLFYLRRVFFLVRYPKVWGIARAQRNLQRNLSPDARIALGKKKFSDLVSECARNNVFYRNLWLNLGLDLGAEIFDPRFFPIVTRKMVREGLTDGTISREGRSKDACVWLKTTGSTGEPLVFPIDRNGMILREASRLLAREGYGHRVGDRMVSLWRGKIGRATRKERILSFLHGESRICIFDPDKPVESALSPQRIAEIATNLNAIDPEHIDGYVSALVLIARRSIEAGRTHQGPSLRTVITGAESLSESDRKVISEYFGVPVMNRYGGTEASIMAHEFADGESGLGGYLRVCAEKVMVELVDESGEYVPAGEVGRVVITDFTNALMPLVRYDVGDYARGLTCGIQYGLIEVVGRRNTFFVNSDGNLISTHIWQNYLRGNRFIEAFLIEQVAQNDVRVYVKMADDSITGRESVCDLKARIETALPGVVVQLNYVDEVPRGIGGKHVQCISHVV